MSTATDFIRQQLAATGWAPINHDAAKMLCPDVANDWRSFTAGQNSPDMLVRTFPGAALYRAQVPGLGEMLVLSRSPQFLAERLGWLGFPAVSVVEILPAAVKVPAQAPAGPDFREALKAKAEERLKRLCVLAEEELPAHDCQQRREILAARAELEQLETA